MHSVIIVSILFIIIILIFIQKLNLRIIKERDLTRIIFDYSFFSLVLIKYKDGGNKQKLPTKNALLLLRSLPRPIRIILSSSEIKLHSLIISSNEQDPARSAFTGGAIVALLSPILPKIATGQSEILFFTALTRKFHFDIEFEFRLYKLLYASSLFLIEYLKRKARKAKNV